MLKNCDLDLFKVNKNYKISFPSMSGELLQDIFKENLLSGYNVYFLGGVRDYNFLTTWNENPEIRSKVSITAVIVHFRAFRWK